MCKELLVKYSRVKNVTLLLGKMKITTVMSTGSSGARDSSRMMNLTNIFVTVLLLKSLEKLPTALMISVIMVN
jgi:hypothetical protein